MLTNILSLSLSPFLSPLNSLSLSFFEVKMAERRDEKRLQGIEAKLLAFSATIKECKSSIDEYKAQVKVLEGQIKNQKLPDQKSGFRVSFCINNNFVF